MEEIAPLPFPRASIDPLEHDLTEIAAAIDLVAGGLATRVQLVGLIRPEAAAPSGLARAQLRGVAFHLDRRGDARFAVTVGPRLHG
jgi:hypothetical protein